MNPSLFESWSLPTRHLGREIRVFGELDSTNSYALARADDPALAGLVVIARTQSAGRGQYGRTWTAPANSSVLLSVLVFPPESLRRPAFFISWAAVAVCEVIQALTGAPAHIKWPNDILIQGHKVCGILIEQRTTGHRDFPLATVIGIGLNVGQPASFFAQAGLPQAGSLASLTGCEISTDDVARALILQLDNDYDRLLQGDFANLESHWQAKLGLVGQRVVVEGTDGEFRGQLLEIAFNGLVLREDDELIHLAPEAVRHVYREVTD